MESWLPPSIAVWAREPAAQTFAALVLGLVIIVAVTRALRRTLATYVSDNTARYQARKLAAFAGYLTAAVFVALMFSDRLGGLTVAFGVAGAGIAFALQEVKNPALPGGAFVTQEGMCLRFATGCHSSPLFRAGHPG